MCLCAPWLRGRDAWGPRATPHQKMSFTPPPAVHLSDSPPLLSHQLPPHQHHHHHHLLLLLTQQANQIFQTCSLKLWNCLLCKWRVSRSDHLRGGRGGGSVEPTDTAVCKTNYTQFIWFGCKHTQIKAGSQSFNLIFIVCHTAGETLYGLRLILTIIGGLMFSLRSQRVLNDKRH